MAPPALANTPRWVLASAQNLGGAAAMLSAAIAPALLRFSMHPIEPSGRSYSSQAPKRHWSAITAALLAGLGLAACGGGGGSASNGPQPLGLVKVTVLDAYGTPVPDAKLQSPSGNAITDAQGVALVLLPTPDSSADVLLSRSTFVDTTVRVTGNAGSVKDVTATLVRATAPAGGSMRSRSGYAPVLDGTGQQLSFEIELVVVQGNSQPIETLSLADFVLRACTPESASVRNGRADCLRGAGSADADAAYSPATAAPTGLQLVPGLAARPYAAALLLDQSGSIAATDPTGARLYSSKAFIDGLGVEDYALLAAFAGGSAATLPTKPLTVYGGFQGKSAARAQFPTLNSLGSLVGGNTPLYTSIDALRQRVVDDTTLSAGLSRALLVFTDGADTTCATADTCRSQRDRTILSARQAQMRLFTIGLAQGIDVATLGELADRTGGAFLYAENTAQFLALYGSVGKLMSLSLPTYRLRWTVQAAAGASFRPGDTLLGKVQVSAAGSRFDVPFIVVVP